MLKNKRFSEILVSSNLLPGSVLNYHTFYKWNATRMTVTFEQFQQNFKGHPVPEVLIKLLQFQNHANNWYSGSFELDNNLDALFISYIGENHALEKQFIPFGHDSNGSVYALWLHKEMSLEQAPVVYLNSEGEGSTVLANTFLDFLLILAYDEEPIFGEYSETEEQIVHTPANQAFRMWLRETYHLTSIDAPDKIVQQALLQQPDFKKWLAMHQSI